MVHTYIHDIPIVAHCEWEEVGKKYCASIKKIEKSQISLNKNNNTLSNEVVKKSNKWFVSKGYSCLCLQWRTRSLLQRVESHCSQYTLLVSLGH